MTQRLPLIPTVFFILILCGLGTWQLHRLEWKKGILAGIEAAQKAEPINLNQQYLRNLTINDYQRVTVLGRFDHTHEFYMPSRVHKGDVGFHIVTPLTTPMGQTYLINRGWVPHAQELPATRAAGQVSGEVQITGIARLPAKPTRWQPPNDIPRNRWYGYDLTLMYLGAEIKTDAPQFYIEADDAPNPGGLPIGGVTKLEIPNNHLQYALTWYSLAVLIGLIFAVNRFKRAA